MGPTERQWQNLVKTYEEEWPYCECKDELIAAVGDKGLAIVICGALGPDALMWLDSSPPVLDGEMPRQLLQTNEGVVKLKACLMRMP